MSAWPAMLPFTESAMANNEFPLIMPDDVLQLQADTLNWMEGRVSGDSFTEEYKVKMKNYYRFSAFKATSDSNRIAHRIRQTLDIV